MRDLYAEIIIYRARRLNARMSRCIYVQRPRVKGRASSSKRRGEDLHLFYNAAFFFNPHARDSQRWTTTNTSPEFHSTSARITQCFRQKLIKMTPTESPPPRLNWQSWWSWSWQTGWCLPYSKFLEETPPRSSAWTGARFLPYGKS